jgi:hypothetical protein
MVGIVAADSVQSLIVYCQEKNRVCPMPESWNRLWKTLPNGQREGKFSVGRMRWVAGNKGNKPSLWRLSVGVHGALMFHRNWWGWVRCARMRVADRRIAAVHLFHRNCRAVGQRPSSKSCVCQTKRVLTHAFHPTHCNELRHRDRCPAHPSGRVISLKNAG